MVRGGPCLGVLAGSSSSFGHHGDELVSGVVSQLTVSHMARTDVLVQQVVELVNLCAGLDPVHGDNQSCIWFHRPHLTCNLAHNQSPAPRRFKPNFFDYEWYRFASRDITALNQEGKYGATRTHAASGSSTGGSVRDVFDM